MLVNGIGKTGIFSGRIHTIGITQAHMEIVVMIQKIGKMNMLMKMTMTLI